MDQFEKIYRDNADRIYRFIYNLCNDRALAEELTSETFYQAFLSFHKFRANSTIYTWLVSIAKYTYFKYLKKNKIAEGTCGLDSITEDYPASATDRPEESVIRDETMATVRNKVKHLPPKYRDVMTLRLYAELPFSEIAAMLNISENSAKVIYCRAKKMLSEELKHEYEL